jgi:IS1 family transposase
MPGLPDHFLIHRRDSLFPDTTPQIQVRSSGQLECRRCQQISHLKSPIRRLEYGSSMVGKSSQILPTIQSKQYSGYGYREIQADEIRTFTGNKKKASWIFATMDVWSRFWPGTVTGSRNYDNTKSTIRSISKLTDPQRVPLITTDGYKFYERAIRKCFGKCPYAQVIKTRRNDRVTKVERRMIIGDKRDFEKALLNSEDSETLNTSFHRTAQSDDPAINFFSDQTNNLLCSV